MLSPKFLFRLDDDKRDCNGDDLVNSDVSYDINANFIKFICIP